MEPTEMETVVSQKAASTAQEKPTESHQSRQGPRINKYQAAGNG